MQKTQSIWKTAFSSGGAIRHTARKNGEKSRSALCGIKMNEYKNQHQSMTGVFFCKNVV